jgi:hypothetical protein
MQDSSKIIQAGLRGHQVRKAVPVYIRHCAARTVQGAIKGYVIRSLVKRIPPEPSPKERLRAILGHHSKNRKKRKTHDKKKKD